MIRIRLLARIPVAVLAPELAVAHMPAFSGTTPVQPFVPQMVRNATMTLQDLAYVEQIPERQDFAVTCHPAPESVVALSAPAVVPDAPGNTPAAPISATRLHR